MLVAPVLVATVLTGASSTSATSMCYKPQWYSYSVSTSGTVTVLLALVCYGVSDMSHGHNSTVFSRDFPKN